MDMTLEEIIQLKPFFRDDYVRRVRVTSEEDDANLKESCRKWNAEFPFSSRDDRNMRAKKLLNYIAKSQKDCTVIKAYTGPDAELPRLWEANGLGITCVALRGIDSLCVVANESDLLAVKRNLLRFEDGEDITTFSIWNALVNEIEGIEDQDHSCKRPFCVVTLALKTGHEDSTANYCAKNTSKFLQDEMKCGATSTCDKTIQTTISAFQHLCCREFEPHEIRAFVWKDGDILGKELQQRREKPDIDELLAIIRDLANDDPDLFTPNKGAAPDNEECKGNKQWLRRHKFHPAAVVNAQEGGSSRFSKKSKASEMTSQRHLKRQHNAGKVEDQRRQRKKKVRKLSSKKANKEKGEGCSSG